MVQNADRLLRLQFPDFGFVISTGSIDIFEDYIQLMLILLHVLDVLKDVVLLPYTLVDRVCFDQCLDRRVLQRRGLQPQLDSLRLRNFFSALVFSKLDFIEVCSYRYVVNVL